MLKSKMSALTLMISASLLLIVVACTNGGDVEPTTTPISLIEFQPERVPGFTRVSENTALWVTKSQDILLDADELTVAHQELLRGRNIVFAESGNTVREDERFAAVVVNSSDGLSGVTLVGSDGYKMALHLFEFPDTTVGSIKFMQEFGLTLLSLNDPTGGKIVAINNYGVEQFVLPVSNSAGTLRYSPDELGYMVLDRRVVAQELELVSLTDPADTVVVKRDPKSSSSTDLYQRLEDIISDWQ
jgi:hypothetical protein